MNEHDVGFVHRGDTLPATARGIVEGITCNTFGCLPSDELDGLYDTIDNLATQNPSNTRPMFSQQATEGTHLVLDTRVFSLSVFTDEDGVDIVVWSLEALDGDARTNVGKQVEGTTKRQVQRNVALADWEGAQ